MRDSQNLRKRRRKGTLTPRFGDSKIALEISLIRMSQAVQIPLKSSEDKDKSKE